MDIEEIRILIELKKVKQSQIAKVAGVTQPTISRWINGETKLKTEAYLKLEKYLKDNNLITTKSDMPQIDFSISELQPKHSETDIQLLALSEEDKKLALDFVKFIHSKKYVPQNQT